MDHLAVSFASFIFGQDKEVKKSLIMSPKVILPLQNEVTGKFIEDISFKSPSLRKMYSKSIIPLESIVGDQLYSHWRKFFTNFFDPKQNIAIGIVPGWESVEGIFKKGNWFIRQFFPVYSWCCSACLFDDHNISSLSNDLEMKSINECIKLDDDDKSAFELFTLLDEMVFFNVENLSWEQIADLRESKFFKDFTKTLGNLKSIERQKPGGAYYAVLSDLFQFVGETESNLSESILKGIFCNLPIPPINPFGISESIREIMKTKDLRSKYGYLFFINEVREKSASGETTEN